jgi:haloalkane dehalogenase
VDRLPRRRLAILDSEMAFVDAGQGDPVVFLHGNPTWSYLWRNIIPFVAPFRRCLAPDLIGMGQSGKPRTHGYRLLDHIRYLDAWFDAAAVERKVALVGHDWGGVLAFHWAHRFPEHVSAIAYMETFVQSRRWDALDEGAKAFMRRVRSDEGKRMMLDESAFVEIGLPRLVVRPLLPQEMQAYRAPFATRESRLPTLVWPREQPIDGEPEDVTEIVELWTLARAMRHPEALCRRRAGRVDHKRSAGLLPQLAQSARNHRPWTTFGSGRCTARDRRGALRFSQVSHG